MKRSKLKLNRETVKNIGALNLRGVAGGSFIWCTATCQDSNNCKTSTLPPSCNGSCTWCVTQCASDLCTEPA